MDNFVEKLDRDLTAEHRSWKNMVQAFLDEDGCPFFPYLMKTQEFTLKPDTVEIQLDDGVVTVPRFDASVFWRSFEDGTPYDRYQDMAMLNMLDSGAEFNFSTLQRADRDEGQLKLMLNYVVSFVALKPSQPLSVLVIGSQGDVGIGGLSFEPLAQWLSTLGYRGEFVLYDPNENVTQTYQVDNFKFDIQAREYDYSRPEYRPDKFDVVLEDVYVPNMTPQQTPPQFQGEKIAIRKGMVPFGDSTYVVYRDTRNAVRVRVWAGNRKTTKHKQHGLARTAYRKILGGGHVKRTREDCVVYGSSMTYGSVPRATVNELFSELTPRYENVNHGREAFDPDWNILKHHRKARISTKYYGEKVPPVPHRIEEQYYYTGHEKRLLIRHPNIEHKRVRCCTAHSILDTVSAAMVCHTGADLKKSADILYGKVAKKYCSPYAGVHLLAAKNRWLAAARMQQTKREAENHIVRNLRVTPTLANRALLLLLRQKQIRIVRVKEHATIDDFVVPEMRKGRCVLWTTDAKYYFDPLTSTYYQASGDLAEDAETLAPLVKHAYLERTSTRKLVAGADLFSVVRALDVAGVKWSRIFPYPIRGTGAEEVTVDKFRSEVAVITPYNKTHPRASYKKIGGLNGYSVYRKKKRK